MADAKKISKPEKPTEDLQTPPESSWKRYGAAAVNGAGLATGMIVIVAIAQGVKDLFNKQDKEED